MLFYTNVVKYGKSRKDCENILLLLFLVLKSILHKLYISVKMRICKLLRNPIGELALPRYCSLRATSFLTI
jgi:hypothetical protein